MNKTTSFHPALILILWAKFLPVRLLRPVRLFIFCHNSTLYAYSGSTLIRETRVHFPKAEIFLNKVGLSYVVIIKENLPKICRSSMLKASPLQYLAFLKTSKPLRLE